MKKLKNKFPINKKNQVCSDFLANPTSYQRLAKNCISKDDEAMKKLNILIDIFKDVSAQFISILKEEIYKNN